MRARLHNFDINFYLSDIEFLSFHFITFTFPLFLDVHVLTILLPSFKPPQYLCCIMALLKIELNINNNNDNNNIMTVNKMNMKN